MNKLVITALLLMLSVISYAGERANIQVNASGSVDALPDFIRIHIDIEKTHKSRDAAKIACDIVAQQVIDIAKRMHIEDTHIEASDIFIQPQYEWNNNKRIHTGETVRRTVDIKLYQLESYSNLAENMATLDITSMQQQGFGFDNIEEYQNQALMLALDKAGIKAQQIAHKIQRKLGKVYQVTESTDYPQPFFANRMMAMEEKTLPDAAPLEIKPQSVNANVNVIYLLE